MWRGGVRLGCAVEEVGILEVRQTVGEERTWDERGQEVWRLVACSIRTTY